MEITPEGKVRLEWPRPLKMYKPSMKLKRCKGKFRLCFCNPLDAQKVAYDWCRNDIWGNIYMTDFVKRDEYFWKDLEGWDGTKVMAVEMSKKPAAEMYYEFRKKQYEAPRKPGTIRVPYPHPKQRAIIYDKHRFKVMVCGRRFGKTTAALVAALDWAVKNPGHIIFYVAPFRSQAKSIAWKLLDEYIGDTAKRRNEQELMFELINGSQIYLKGADNPDSLRGTKVHFCILDEYADMKPNVWSEILRPQTADTRGHAWFLGTPRGYDHFYELWHSVFKGDKGDDWIAFRLTTYDNPYVPKEEIQAARDQEDERAFAQEYLAEFVQFEGLVYQDFFRGVHVEDFDINKIKGIDIVGCDFGADHPTAAIFCRLKGNMVYVYDEFYQSDVVASEMAKECLLKEERAGKKVRKRYLDPSAKGFSLELQKCKYRTEKAVNDRSYGIAKIRALLRQKNIVIHPRCTNLIYEFEHHRYKKVRQTINSASKEKDVNVSVLKVDDDALDALRYALASFFKGTDVVSAGAERAGVDSKKAWDGDIPTTRRVSFDKKNLDQPHRSAKADMPVAAEFKGLS